MFRSKKFSLVLAVSTLGLTTATSAPIYGQALEIAQVPLFEIVNPPPMNMLIMGRDHSLFYQAYNDASDLTGDGAPDVGYKPDEIDYFGYFDSFKCYNYQDGMFRPQSQTDSKKCGSGWSGDFLNWVTTSRIDALRKVLYGGSRYVDNEDRTVLQRSYIPQDAHSWGKEYQSIERDGYDIRDYTPLSLPSPGNYHLFANTSLLASPNIPRMRVLRNTTYRVWEWVAIERPVAGNRCLDGGSGPICTDSADGRDDYTVRVEVCHPDFPEDNCLLYPSGHRKPIGLLQEFGQEGQMHFGLLTGSYLNNMSGGVLRKPMGSIASEIDLQTGQFEDIAGIISTIDSFRITGFGYNGHNYYPGWQNAWLTTRQMNQGEFPDWGNPVAEMVYEALRYFAGKEAPTAAFLPALNANGEEVVTLRNPSGTLNLAAASWDDPYASRLWCTKAANLIISNTNISFDGDHIPGSAFSDFTGDLPDFNAQSLGQEIWNLEHGSGTTGQHFIGQSGAFGDGAPTVKSVTSLGNIRGLSPEEPTREGTYYTASAARWGVTRDIRPDLTEGEQRIETFSVALASQLPRIEMPVGNDQIVSLVPFGKSVQGCIGTTPNRNAFQPMAQIVDFFVEQWANTHPQNMDASVNEGRPYASFRINFEDVEQAADHDMDGIVRYEIQVLEDGRVSVSLTPEYYAGCIKMNVGYVISGVEAEFLHPTSPGEIVTESADGLYLEVRGDPSTNDNMVYYLNTPPDIPPGACAAEPIALQYQAACNSAPGLPPNAFGTAVTRVFTPTGGVVASVLRDPLWYAAKYGNTANEGMPPGETPENYFLVTNAATLQAELQRAFQQILELGASSGLVASSTRLDLGTLVYQAQFDSIDWSGDLIAINPQNQDVMERASTRLAARNPADRKILTIDLEATANPGVPFTTNDLPQSIRDRLAENVPGDLDLDVLIDYLRGDDSFEQGNGGGDFRSREAILGDIVRSQPTLSARQNFGWAPVSADYIDFIDEIKANRESIVMVGSNNGMMHAFAAETGADLLEERFAYIPASVHRNLHLLADPDYTHRFFVDGTAVVGDARIGSGDGAQAWRTVALGTLGAGGRGLFALDITDPDDPIVMWEFTSEDVVHGDYMGYSFSRPAITRLEGVEGPNQWVAIFGNGYNSVDLQAQLFVVRLIDGEVLHRIPLGTAGSNGLSSIAAVRDPDARTHVDRVYAGDLEGNVWRVDFNNGNPVVAFSGQPLFTDPDGRAITAAPDAALHPVEGWMVYFGTGKLVEFGDRLDLSSTDRIYAVHDRDMAIANLSGLSQVVIEASDEPGLRDVTSPGPGADGWYASLNVAGEAASGERVLSEPQVIFGRVVFTTYEPSNDPCASGGTTFVYQLRALTGAGPGGAISEGPPIAPPLVIRDPQIGTPPSPGQPGFSPDDFEICEPGDPDCEVDDPTDAPAAAAGSPDDWCREYGLLIPPDSQFVRLGNLCEGRSVWRQIR